MSRRRPSSAPSVRRRLCGLRTERHGGVSYWTLDPPRRRNRIDLDLAQALVEAAEEIELDDSASLVVLRASERAFCLGEEEDLAEASIDWVEAIAALSCPTVAVLAGSAEAEGFELALACDLRIASTQARFVMPQLQRGYLPRRGGTQRLPRLLGRSRALDLLLTGRALGAKEALDIGLLSRLAPPSRLDRVVEEIVATLHARGPLALRYAKEAVWKGIDMSLEQGIRFEQDLYALLQSSRDRREGIDAFLAKRKPVFQGR